MWKGFFTPESLEQFTKYGYYDEPLKLSNGKVYEKVRVIGLNTQACYYWNYYLISQRNDPGNQLEWLESTLREMQTRGEKAIIIGHVPPADTTCVYNWAARFTTLVERYQDVVRL